MQGMKKLLALMFHWFNRERGRGYVFMGVFLINIFIESGFPEEGLNVDSFFQTFFVEKVQNIEVC